MVSRWRHIHVEDVCERVGVGIVVKPAQYYVGQDAGVRAFRSANVAEDGVVDRDWVYLSPEGHAANSKSALQEGDVLVVRSGAPGTACVVTKEFDGSNCIDLVIARPRRSDILPEYLAIYTNSSAGIRHVNGTKGGLALQHFNVGAYKRLEIPLPPLEEQRRIAGVLKTWDEALSLLDRLIAAKERRLRRLISRCVAEIASASEAELLPIGSIADVSKGFGLTKADMSDEGVPCLRYAEIYTSYGETIDQLGSKALLAAAAEARDLAHGDVILAASGEKLDDIGKAVAYVGNERAVVGGDTLVVRGHNLNPTYLALVLNSSFGVRQKRRLGEGHSVVHLYGDDAAGLLVPVPNRKDQDALAALGS